MECEEKERGEDTDSDHPDPFIAEGLSSSDDGSSASDVGAGGAARGRNSDGKRFREALKAKLFRSQEKKRQRRPARRAEEWGL
jgi:hypothetical protein